MAIFPVVTRGQELREVRFLNSFQGLKMCRNFIRLSFPINTSTYKLSMIPESYANLRCPPVLEKSSYGKIFWPDLQLLPDEIRGKGF